MAVEKKKYIIELPENTHWIQWIMESTKDHHPYMDFKQLENLTPYTEPDLDAIREEEYEKGVQDTKQHWVDAPRTCAYKLGYENGLNDAWEAARKIWEYDITTLKAIFGNVKAIFGNVAMRMDCYTKFTAAEAIEKIRAYEQAQKEKEEQEKEKSITAEDVMRQYLDVFCKGRVCTGCPLHAPNFTCGRGYHFTTKNPISNEEVRRAYTTVLQKMKEE